MFSNKTVLSTVVLTLLLTFLTLTARISGQTS